MTKQNCTIELREYNKNGEFKHYVFFNLNGSNEKEYIKMSNGGVERQKKHCFGFIMAAKLFDSYFETKEWPEGVDLEDIRHQFKQNT